MTGGNLVPRPRREALRVRRRVTLWAGVLCANAALVGVAYGVSRAALDFDRAGLSARLELSQRDAEEKRASIKELLERLALLERNLAANRNVGEQPDWSVLLKMLSERLGTSAVLRSVSLRPAMGRDPVMIAAGEQLAADGPAYSVLLSGVAAEQGDVTELALRLEQCGLFERVTLRQSRRDSFDGRPAVVFELACDLNYLGETPLCP